MRLKKIVLMVVLSSFYLGGCNTGGGADASQEATELAAETISQEIMEALKSKTVDVEGYYIATDIKSSGEKTEKEQDKGYKGFLKEMEVVEQTGEIVTVKAYLVDHEDFFTTAEKVELEYNTEDGSIEIKTDKIKIEPTVFFDVNMFFDNEIFSAYAVYNNSLIKELPELTEENIKDIILLYAVDDKKVKFNDFYFDGYVNIIDKDDNLYSCKFILNYIPHSGHSGFTREKMEQNQWPVWAVKIVGVEKIE